MTKGEAQKVELLLRRGKQEVGLIAGRIGGAMQLGLLRAGMALDIIGGFVDRM